MITLTEAANNYIKKTIEKNQGIGFRLSLKKTGCSGYTYSPTVIKEVNPADSLIETNTNLSIYVDSDWASLLMSLSIDYVEENKSGLKQKRLIFTNAKEDARCGCGESFTVKAEVEDVS